VCAGGLDWVNSLENIKAISAGNTSIVRYKIWYIELKKCRQTGFFHSETQFLSPQGVFSTGFMAFWPNLTHYS
jgi:hypothetical protein